jgi:cysteine desulfurase
MPVYLDHNATSPMHPQVVDAMLPFLQNPTGNPSSLHSYGRMARSAIESARAEVANLLGCSSSAVIFTSGGTEANNLLLKGYVDKILERPIVSSEIEHSSIFEPLRQLQAEGQAVILLKPDHDGLIDLQAAAPILASADAQ